MNLKAFDRNGYAEITISESEVNALCNALYEYFEVYNPQKVDKRLYEVRRQLYIIYEVIHHNACFDETTFRILEKMQPKEDENGKLNGTGEQTMKNDDRLFKFLQKCQRNHHKPDLHSFGIQIRDGTAFVECRGHEVYIETRTYGGIQDTVDQWCGTTVAAANRLEMLGADWYTIDM